MAAEDELKDIKQILASIRDQNKISSSATQSALDYKQYASELKLARDELNLLEKGTGAYNRKLREVERLSGLTKNALKDQRRETDALSLSINGLGTAMDMLGNSIDTVVVKLAGLVSSIMGDVKELDNLTVQFQAATGASAAMAGNISGLTDRLRAFGVSNEEAASAVKSVYGNFTLFTRLNEETQDSLLDTVGLMGELGVSSDTSAKLLESSFRTFGMSVEEANGLLIDMRGTARALEIPVEQLTSDFIAQESIIASLGNQGVDAFKKISAASKSTGISVGGLMDIYKKFDDFDTAANIAADLQSFGINLDFMTLQMEQDPLRRLQMIREGFLQAGYSAETFTNMHRSTQLALAQPLGQDIPGMIKLLGDDMEGLVDTAMQAEYTFEEMKKDAFGLKGFDKVLNNMTNSFKRPIEEIQKAGRRTFEAFTPTIKMFEKYSADMIEKTELFVKSNSELVGGLAIAYNMLDLDVIQKSYNAFKGIMSFSGSLLSNMFTFKGLMAALVGGGFYLIRDQLGDIIDTFTDQGIIAGLKALGSAFVDLFNDFKTKAIDAGFDKQFFVSLGNLVFDAAIFGFYKVKEFLAPVFDYMKVYFIKLWEDMEADGTLDAIGEKIAYIFKKALSFIPGLGWLDPDTSLIGPDPGQGFMDYLIDMTGGFAGAEPESKKARSTEEIAKQVAAEREIANKDLANNLAKAEKRMVDSYDAYGKTKGAQAIDAKTAIVMDKTAKAIEVIEPRLEKVGNAIDKTLTSVKDGLVDVLGQAVEVLGKMNESQKDAHNAYTQGFVMEMDGRKVGELTARHVDSKMKGKIR